MPLMPVQPGWLRKRPSDRRRGGWGSARSVGCIGHIVASPGRGVDDVAPGRRVAEGWSPCLAACVPALLIPRQGLQVAPPGATAHDRRHGYGDRGRVDLAYAAGCAELLGEAATPQEAAALVVAYLPSDCGTAVAGPWPEWSDSPHRTEMRRQNTLSGVDRVRAAQGGVGSRWGRVGAVKVVPRGESSWPAGRGAAPPPPPGWFREGVG
ncbi:DUF6193 family natural product biosynthesis protein [Streptomyces sp. NPDC054932]